MKNYIYSLKNKLKLNNFRKKYSDPEVNKDCGEFEINKWMISEFILKELIPIVGIKPFPLDEQMLMASAVCKLKPTHIFEWGTHIGKSARIFYETIKYFGIASKIYSIDLPDDQEHQEHPRQKCGLLVKNIKDIRLYQGDGLSKSLEIYHSINIIENIRPLFFLDGDHAYRSVIRELKGIIKNVDNPSILIHDTFFQTKKSKYNVGPHRAIQEILSKYNYSFNVMEAKLGLPGMTLLYNLELK